MDNRLKRIADNLDSMIIGLDEPFKFHCTMCGKCCINREDSLLNPRDMYRMAKALGISPGELFDRCCETYIGSDSHIPIVRLKPRGPIKRCPLLKDRKCSVHEAKPTVCALFPLGRCVLMARPKSTIGPEDVKVILDPPHCGDSSETHTPREWKRRWARLG